MEYFLFTDFLDVYKRQLLLIGLSNITGIQILIPMGKEKYVLYSEIAGATINLIINAILIPRLGASGAATVSYTHLIPG